MICSFDLKVLMKPTVTAVMVAITSLLLSPARAASFEIEKLGNGFSALYEQIDPFDSKNKSYKHFSKGGFYFKCEKISFGESGSRGFDSFSFGAEVALKVDNNEPIFLSGTYSTYIFGSDLVNDDRMYSARLSDDAIKQIKAGRTLQASGKFGGSGWTAYKLELTGFTVAYDKVCK